MHYEQYKQVAQRHQARAYYARGPFTNFGQNIRVREEDTKNK